MCNLLILKCSSDFWAQQLAIVSIKSIMSSVQNFPISISNNISKINKTV